MVVIVWAQCLARWGRFLGYSNGAPISSGRCRSEKTCVGHGEDECIEFDPIPKINFPISCLYLIYLRLRADLKAKMSYPHSPVGAEGPNIGADKAPKRALPSWMSARDDGSSYKWVNGRQDNDNQVGSSHKAARGRGKGVKDNGEEFGKRRKPNYSKLLEGVVFALSGFVNLECGILRSQALEMGAEYQPDWNSNCTLLVCAFSNTPKFQ